MSKEEVIIDPNNTNTYMILTFHDPSFVALLKNEKLEAPVLQVNIKKSTYDKMVADVMKRFIDEHFE